MKSVECNKSSTTTPHKKALQAGNRGHKTLDQDMDDIVASAIRARELSK